MSKEHDPVNHPSHYTAHPSGVECITVTEQFNFCIGNAIKYLWRADEKDGMQDLLKAQWYVTREIARRKKEADSADIRRVMTDLNAPVIKKVADGTTLGPIAIVGLTFSSKYSGEMPITKEFIDMNNSPLYSGERGYTTSELNKIVGKAAAKPRKKTTRRKH